MKPPILPLLTLGCLMCLCWVGCEPSPPSISLHQAVEQGNLRVVQQHIMARTDLNKPDAAGWTALHLAAVKGNLAMVQALVEAGADVNRPGQGGKTPIAVAREKGHTTIVQFLQQPREKRGRALMDGGVGVSGALDALSDQ